MSRLPSTRALLAILAAAGLGALAVGFGRGDAFFHNRRAALDQLSPAPHPAVPAEGAESPAARPEDVAARIGDYTARIGEAATAMSPHERRALLATQRVFAPMAARMAAYEAAARELDDAGVTSPATLDSPEAIRDRIALVKKLKAANRALLDFYRGLDKKYRDELAKEALPDSIREEVLAGFARGASIETNLAIRECAEQIDSARLEILQLLNREWGFWNVQPAGELAFEHDAALSQYMALQETLRQTVKRQQVAQKKLFEQSREQRQPTAKKG